MTTMSSPESDWFSKNPDAGNDFEDIDLHTPVIDAAVRLLPMAKFQQRLLHDAEFQALTLADVCMNPARAWRTVCMTPGAGPVSKRNLRVAVCTALHCMHATGKLKCQRLVSEHGEAVPVGLDEVFEVWGDAECQPSDSAPVAIAFRH